jgi:hypothetical protein
VEHPVLNEAMICIGGVFIDVFLNACTPTYMNILKLSQYLSAGNGDNFRNEGFRNQEKLKF